MKTQVTEEYKLSRLKARRITARAMGLNIQDFDGINIERLQMMANLLLNLEHGCKKIDQ